MKLFIPTSEFRWVEDEGIMDGKTPFAMQPNYPECGPTYYKLQQAYQNIKDGTIEWRDIEIEHNPK